MASGISPLGPNQITLPPSPGTLPTGLETEKSTNFKDFLISSINEVNTMQTDADRAVETLMTGGDINPAEVLTAVQKADVAFRMMMQMRNKMVQAYEEVKNIRV